MLVYSKGADKFHGIQLTCKYKDYLQQPLPCSQYHCSHPACWCCQLCCTVQNACVSTHIGRQKECPGLGSFSAQPNVLCMGKAQCCFAQLVLRCTGMLLWRLLLHLLAQAHTTQTIHRSGQARVMRYKSELLRCMLLLLQCWLWPQTMFWLVLAVHNGQYAVAPTLAEMFDSEQQVHVPFQILSTIHGFIHCRVLLCLPQ